MKTYFINQPSVYFSFGILDTPSPLSLSPMRNLWALLFDFGYPSPLPVQTSYVNAPWGGAVVVGLDFSWHRNSCTILLHHCHATNMEREKLVGSLPHMFWTHWLFSGLWTGVRVEFRMPHWKWTETNQQSNRVRHSHHLQVQLHFLHFLCRILSTFPELNVKIIISYWFSSVRDVRTINEQISVEEV